MKSPFIYFHVPRGVDSLKAGISSHILCLCSLISNDLGLQPGDLPLLGKEG